MQASLRTEPVGRCPVCGEARSDQAFVGVDRLYGVPGDYHYRRCQGCRSVYQDPRVVPEELPSCYRTYFTHGPAGPRARQRLFPEILPERPGLKAVDLGCGPGDLLARLAEAGWDAEGVEWDPVAAETARTVTGRKVSVGDFRKVSLPEGSFHLVVLMHVFEHLDDPRGALAAVRRLVAPGGRAVIVYPNVDALGARLYGPSWSGWDVPRHLVVSSPEGLLALARETGFASARIVCRAGNASLNFAMSRASANGEPDALHARKRLSESFLGRLENLAVLLGIRVGEELVVVLRPA